MDRGNERKLRLSKLMSSLYYHFFFVLYLKTLNTVSQFIRYKIVYLEICQKSSCPLLFVLSANK